MATSPRPSWGPGAVGSRRAAAWVAQGRTEVVGAPAAVGFAPPQVGQHRVGPEGQGPGEGLDGRGQVAAGQGPVALQEQALIVLFPLDAGAARTAATPAASRRTVKTWRRIRAWGTSAQTSPGLFEHERG